MGWPQEFSSFFALASSLPCNMANSKPLVWILLCQSSISRSQRIKTSRFMTLFLLSDPAATGRQFSIFRCNIYQTDFMLRQWTMEKEVEGLHLPLQTGWSAIQAGGAWQMKTPPSSFPLRMSTLVFGLMRQWLMGPTLI